MIINPSNVILDFVTVDGRTALRARWRVYVALTYDTLKPLPELKALLIRELQQLFAS